MKTLTAIAIFLTLSVGTYAQTTSFTYQGSLKDGGTPANGNYDFQVALYDVPTGGSPINGDVVGFGSVAVVNGVFTLPLGFPASYFPGAARYLEVRVKATGAGAFTTLTPRESVNSSPYSIKSLNAENAVTAANSQSLGGISANQYVTTTNGGANFIQNTTSQQASSNFSISGNGVVGGNFGIGTNTPSAKFHIADGSGQIQMGGVPGCFGVGALGFAGSLTCSNYAIFGDAVNTAVNRPAGGRLFFREGNFDQVEIASGGNVGIGLSGSSPTAKLHVGGNGLFSGNLTANGTLSGNTVNATSQYNLNGNRVLYVDVTSLYAGVGAGFSITSGSGNSFVGQGSGNSTTTGAGNTFVGYSTGSTNLSGNNNTLIGNQPNVLSNNLSNATAIGALASVGASNSLVLGAISGNNFCSPTNNCETVKVGIGTTTPEFRLDVGGRIRLKQDTGSTGTLNTAGMWLFQNTPSIDRGFVGMKDDNSIGLYGNNGGGWSLFTDVSTGVTTVASLGSAGSTQLCRNASSQISTCSSSARYKNNINTFTSGLDLIRRLRPVTFNWKDGGMADMGLVAEEVNAVEPLLTTTNAKGEVEGVKYDRIGIVLVNAVKEQQTQIEAQDAKIKALEMQLEAFKALICSQNASADVCRPKK